MFNTTKTKMLDNNLIYSTINNKRQDRDGFRHLECKQPRKFRTLKKKK